jgi:Gpi18-like mannosyltransferase
MKFTDTLTSLSLASKKLVYNIINELLNKKPIFFFAIILIGLVIKLLFIPFQSGDYTVFLNPWIHFITEHGYFSSLKYNFNNYSPAYIYILILIAKTGLNSLYLIKLVSIIFEFILAFYVGKILFLKHNNKIVFLISAAILPLIPTILINSSFWGQCDVIYATFVTAGVFYSLVNRQLLSVIMLSIGIAFKIQAIFILPYYFILLLTGKTKWYYFFAIPVIYFLSVLPAWLSGRDLVDLLSIYMNQSDYYQSLTMFMPNIYIFIENLDYKTFKFAGMLLTSVLTLWAGLYIKKLNINLNNDTLILIGFLSVIVCPFILPGMHERYLYLGDVLAFIFIFWFKQNIRIPISILFVSFYAYVSCTRFRELIPHWPAFIIYAGVIYLTLKKIKIQLIKKPEKDNNES